MKEKHFGPVWFIPGENHGRYPYCHSLYIEGPGIIVDPASDRKRLMQLKDNPGVKEVWLTHFHEDHIMHLDLFDDLPICISEIDASPLSDVELFLEAYGFGEDYTASKRDVLKEEFNFRPRKAARFLQDGETINLGDVSVKIIGTPGHTPGHLSFFFKEPGVLFLGDYDLTSFGPWYGDLDSDMDATVRSVQVLKKIPAKVWLTSHEKGIFESEPGEAWDQYLKVIDKREEKLIQFLETPKTIQEIIGAGIVYGKYLKSDDFTDIGEKALMQKHLEKLIQGKRVVEKNGCFVQKSLVSS